VTPRPRERVVTPPHGGLLAAAAALAATGLVMVWSTTAPLALDAWIPPHFARHAAGVAFGIPLALLCMALPLSAWRRLAVPLWALCVGLLALTLTVGTSVNGARRWLSLPGLGPVLQPGELARFATLLAIAVALTARESAGGRRPSRLPVSGLVLGLAIVPAALVFAQPDTKGAALLLLLVTIQLFVAGTPLRAFAIPGGLALATLGAAVAVRPYVLDRVRAVLDPWKSAQDEGFQLVQSFVAFGRGGMLGVGLGDGRQKLGYLPEAHTDFVLSVIGEELGLVGVALVLGAFTALLVAGVRITARARSRFAFLLAFSMTALLAVPALINAAVVMGMVPPTGLTLPLVSYGRSSLLVSFAAVGLLLGMSRRDCAPEPAQPTGGVARRSWST
jgi:cell division protein FtsW